VQGLREASGRANGRPDLAQATEELGQYPDGRQPLPDT
jgi:hypothetical protein